MYEKPYIKFIFTCTKGWGLHNKKLDIFPPVEPRWRSQVQQEKPKHFHELKNDSIFNTDFTLKYSQFILLHNAEMFLNWVKKNGYFPLDYKTTTTKWQTPLDSHTTYRAQLAKLNLEKHHSTLVVRFSLSNQMPCLSKTQYNMLLHTSHSRSFSPISFDSQISSLLP